MRLLTTQQYSTNTINAVSRLAQSPRSNVVPRAEASPDSETSTSLVSRRETLSMATLSAMTTVFTTSTYIFPNASSAWVWDFSFGPQPKLMDAEFANTLVSGLTAVAGTTRTGEFQLRCTELRMEKLPMYVTKDACGHCGLRKDPGAFRDPKYFDFETYIRGKALLMMNTGAVDDDIKRDLYIRNANIAIGSYILKKILEERYTEDAERAGISPFFSVAAMRSEDSLLSASPDLESVRAGVKTLLEYFQRRGFMEKAGVAQCGASAGDEEKTQEAWRKGDGSATLTYWLVNPVDEGSSLTLQDEEGVFLGYVSATIAAFLRRCGVRSSDVQRVKSLDVEGLVIEKSKLVRFKPLVSKDAGKTDHKWTPSPIPTSL